MSTTNTETLTLYKNPKLYNGSRYKKYQQNVNYDDWLNSTSDGVLTKTVYYKSLSEPIDVKEDLPIMDEYTYGVLTAMGKKYYIFIDKCLTDQNGRTSIEFTVDWWSTEWNKMQVTKAHINRFSTKPNYMQQPYVPYMPTVSSEPLTNQFCIMATYIPSVEGEDSYITNIIIDGNENTINLVEQGQWMDIFNIAPSDIKDAFIVPYFSVDDFALSIIPLHERVWDIRSTSDGDDYLDMARYLAYPREAAERPVVGDTIFDLRTNKYYTTSLRAPADEHSGELWSYREISGYDYQVFSIKHMIGEPFPASYRILAKRGEWNDRFYKRTYTKRLNSLSFSSSNVRQEAVVDWNGDLIWQCPIDYSNTGYELRLLLGLSHVMLEFLPTYNIDNAEYLTNKGFCYDCRHPGIFVDSYKDYVLKNREYDIQMRRIQSDKQLFQAGLSTAENIGFGFAFGGPSGAAAAGIGGLIETVGTAAMNEYFDPRIQSEYDRRYKLMTDQIAVIGDSVTNVINSVRNGTGLLKKVTITMDEPSQALMNSDIRVNGYFADEIVSNLSNKFRVGAIIQADNVVVEGNIPLDCRHQVVSRLQKGVEFI